MNDEAEAEAEEPLDHFLDRLQRTARLVEKSGIRYMELRWTDFFRLNELDLFVLNTRLLFPGEVIDSVERVREFIAQRILRRLQA